MLNNQSYQDLEKRAYMFGSGSGNELPSDPDWSNMDASLLDIDFSDIRGNFRQAFDTVNRRVSKGRPVVRKQARAPKRRPAITNSIPIVDRGRYNIRGVSRKKLSKVIVPDDRSVIVEGVSKFILSNDERSRLIKSIGYYRGEKLQELVFIFNNDSAVPFVMELFNPSMPLDYLYSTSQNINDKISVANSQVSYTDVLYNLLGNTILVPNCKFTFAGALADQQINQSLIIKNKAINGHVKIDPISLSSQIDAYQFDKNVIGFQMDDVRDKPYIPDGMDVIEYTILPQMTVVMCFYYKQVSLKRVFFQEARDSKGLM